MDRRSPSSGAQPLPSRAECRQAARAVRRSELGRQALNQVRPRGVPGILRSHAPLPLLLRLAAQQGRLVWLSSASFALLQPPLAFRGGGTRLLRFLDDGWEVLVFGAVAFGLLGAASASAVLLPSAPVVALVLITAALLFVLVNLIPTVVLQAYQLLSGRRRLRETAVGQLRSSNWTVVLCHVEHVDQLSGLLSQARTRLVELAGGSSRALLCLERGLTNRAAREHASSLDMVQPLTDKPPVVVYASLTDPPLAAPTDGGRFQGRDLTVVLGGSAAVLVVLATIIPVAELEACRPAADCSDQPLQFADALYWVGSRLLGGDPEGLGVHSAWCRAIGLLVSVFGIFVVVGLVERVIQQQIDESVASGPALARDFNKRQALRVESEVATRPSKADLASRTWRLGRWRLTREPRE